MLGDAFYHVFRRQYDVRCTDIDLNADWLSHCDIRDPVQYREDVERFEPDFLFHLGALTDLEYCELHPDEAYATNTLAVENAVHIATDLGIPLLYISTAGIFDGKQETYDDWDEPSPLGHYARSKLAGEMLVRESMTAYLVCRAGWMMGGGPAKDKKFIQKLMLQLKQGKRDLYIVNDKLGTPTYTYDFANNVEELLRSGFWGVYNMVCEGVTSRLDVASELVSHLGLADAVRIHEVPSDHFAEDYFAPRPASERLINRKLNLRGLNRMRSWREALHEYLDLAYRGYL